MLETIYPWQIELLVFDRNNWNNLTVCKQMNSIKNYVTYKLFVYKLYIYIYIYIYNQILH